MRQTVILHTFSPPVYLVIDNSTRSLSITEADNVVLICLEPAAGDEIVWIKDEVEISEPVSV